jgi:DUF4097 and DUF4098 domain-containing protein YvlB
MKLHKSILLTVVVLAALATATSLQAAGAERHEYKELSAKSGGTLTLKTVVGSIEIKTHDQNVLTFDSVLKPGKSTSSELIDQIEFDYQTTNGDVTINVRWKDDKQPRNANLNGRHTLVIPTKYNIDVRTSGGSIIGENINGRVAAHTSGGEIRFGNVNGEIKAHTSGGDIALDDVHGDVDVNTSGGNITLGTVEGDVISETSGGNIKLGAVTGNLRGSTSGGSITAELVNQIAKPLELSTSGGNISLTVPGDFKADLQASTSGGRVACKLALEGRIKPSSINGKVNGGGPNVTLHTSGGNIEIAKR